MCVCVCVCVLTSTPRAANAGAARGICDQSREHRVGQRHASRICAARVRGGADLTSSSVSSFACANCMCRRAAQAASRVLVEQQASAPLHSTRARARPAFAIAANAAARTARCSAAARSARSSTRTRRSSSRCRPSLAPPRTLSRSRTAARVASVARRSSNRRRQHALSAAATARRACAPFSLAARAGRQQWAPELSSTDHSN